MNMNASLENKVAVVTGGTSGIGNSTRSDGVAEEVALAAVWLSSPEASFVTGTDIAVEGGFLAQ